MAVDSVRFRACTQELALNLRSQYQCSRNLGRASGRTGKTSMSFALLQGPAYNDCMLYESYAINPYQVLGLGYKIITP